MSPLPSFPELMQSLGLPKDAPAVSSDEGSQCGEATSSRSPSPSTSPKLRERPTREPSPTIVVSQFEADEQPADDSQPGGFKRRASSGNIKSARYSPYSNRRGSVSAIDHQRDEEQTANQSHGHRRTPSSSSSRRSSSGSLSASSASDDSLPPVPPLPVRRARGGSLEHLKLHPAAATFTPISSFARRRSPQVSPTSPSFARERERIAADLPSPVMLPSLPPMLAASFAAFAFPAPASASGSPTMKAKSVVEEAKEKERRRRSTSRSPRLRTHAMDIDEKEKNVFVKHHQAGLRISSFHRHVAPIA